MSFTKTVYLCEYQVVTGRVQEDVQEARRTQMTSAPWKTYALLHVSKGERSGTASHPAPLIAQRGRTQRVRANQKQYSTEGPDPEGKSQSETR